MAKVIDESKHIAKRVLIGVITGVLGTVILYFLYYKKPKATDAELRKNTIAAWRLIVSAENRTHTAFDSNFARMLRQVPTATRSKHAILQEYRKNDSLAAASFIAEMNELKNRENLDKDFMIMLGTRIAYQQQQSEAGRKYSVRFEAIQDSTSISEEDKQDLLIRLNEANRERLNNITIRIGRNIEYFTDALSNRYKYPFLFSDLKYYAVYMQLKKTKSVKIAEAAKQTIPASALP